MGIAFIREEGLPPLWICVDKVFAVSRYFGLLYITFYVAEPSALLSALAPAALAQAAPPVVSARHATQARAIAPGAFHPALPSKLGNQ